MSDVKSEQPDNRFIAAVAFLRAVGCDDVSHSRGSLLTHLAGTCRLLMLWEAPEDVCLAGLFHSVYGTETFDAQLRSKVNRTKVQAVIGQRAERLAWLFATATAESLWRSVQTLGSWESDTPVALMNRQTTEVIVCDGEELTALVNIDLANALDQAQRTPSSWTQGKHRAYSRVIHWALPGAATTLAAAAPQTSQPPSEPEIRFRN